MLSRDVKAAHRVCSDPISWECRNRPLNRVAYRMTPAFLVHIRR
jgi:hypothetical protein